MTKQLSWIEATRTTALTVVVLSHVNDLSYFRLGCKAWWSVGISALVCFAVPAFFMISGFLLGKNEWATSKPKSMTQFLMRTFSRLILPFWEWNVVYMALLKLMFNWPVLSFKTLWFLTTGYMHLYFVFFLVQFFVIFYITQPYLIKTNLKRSLFVSAIFSILFYAVSEALLWTKGADNHFFEWHYGKAFVGWSAFFFWGVWMARYDKIMDILIRRLFYVGGAAFFRFWHFSGKRIWWSTPSDITPGSIFR